jgi:hypothetical protein
MSKPLYKDSMNSFRLIKTQFLVCIHGASNGVRKETYTNRTGMTHIKTTYPCDQCKRIFTFEH